MQNWVLLAFTLYWWRMAWNPRRPHFTKRTRFTPMHVFVKKKILRKTYTEFWKNGNPLKGQPTYKENQDNAKNAWCRLVEKAFAKYHGHYRDVKEMKGMGSTDYSLGILAQDSWSIKIEFFESDKCIGSTNRKKITKIFGRALWILLITSLKILTFSKFMNFKPFSDFWGHTWWRSRVYGIR